VILRTGLFPLPPPMSAMFFGSCILRFYSYSNGGLSLCRCLCRPKIFRRHLFPLFPFFWPCHPFFLSAAGRAVKDASLTPPANTQIPLALFALPNVVQFLLIADPSFLLKHSPFPVRPYFFFRDPCGLVFSSGRPFTPLSPLRIRPSGRFLAPMGTLGAFWTLSPTPISKNPLHTFSRLSLFPP